MAATLQSLQTANPGDGSSITVTKPTGLTVGDLMIFHYVFNDATDTADTMSGWTHEINNAAIGTLKTGIQWKIAASGDVAASNFTMTFSGVVGAPLAGLLRIDGHSSTGLLNENHTSAVNNDAPSFAITVTPSTIDNLLLFFVANNELKTISSYAIATSNPSWSEGYDIQGGSICGAALGYASRSVATATGNASCVLDSGSGTNDSYGILIAIGSTASVNTTVGAQTITSTVVAPAITGTASVTSTVASATLSINAPTVTTPAPMWTNQDKNSTSWTNQNKS